MGTPRDRLPDLRPDQPIARRYRVVELLGHGGQGSVWRAVDELRGADVAVKLVAAEGRAAAVQREAMVLRALRLPGVARLLDEGAWEGAHFLVTELVPGAPFPGRPTPAAWPDLAEPARTLLEALGHVHREGIAHGDLKPANVLVDRAGRCRLLDFGMAHAAEGVLHADGRGPLGGTLHYLAPEVSAGRRPSVLSDLFAVGVMLFRALTGLPPWEARTLDELVAARAAGPARRPGAVGAELPPAVEQALAALLAVNPAERPPSAAAALRAMELAAPDRALPLPWAAQGPRLTAAELAGAFHGPERVLHLPSDAAALLLDATGGDRARVAVELRAWIEHGVATLDGERLRIERASLYALRTRGALPLGLPVSAPPPGDRQLRRLLATVALAREHAHAALLAEVAGLSRQQLDACLARLTAGGAVEQDDGGRWRDLTGGACLADLLPRERAALHAALARALRPGAAARLPHLLAAGAPTAQVVETAERIARDQVEAGRLDDAMATVELAFQRLRADPYAPVVAGPLFDVYTQAALCTEAPPALARAAWELRRLPRHQGRDARAALLDASHRALTGQPEAALELATSLPVAELPDLACWVAAVEIQAARHLAVEGEEFVLEQVDAWTRAHPAPEHEAALAGWLGHLRFRQGRFDEAATLHARSVRGRTALHERVAATLHEAEALLEAARYRAAERQALQARVLAAEARDTLLEAQAWWIPREVAARTRAAVAPDEELVGAVHLLGQPRLGGRVALTEAVIARNGGLDEACARLALRARAGFHAAGLGAAAVLAAALAAAAGDGGGLWWAREHLGEVDPRAEPLRMLQSCALLTQATGSDDWASLGRALLPLPAHDAHDRPLEVLTLGEALALVGA